VGAVWYSERCMGEARVKGFSHGCEHGSFEGMRRQGRMGTVLWLQGLKISIA